MKIRVRKKNRNFRRIINEIDRRDYIAIIIIGLESTIKSPHVKHGVDRKNVCTQ